MGPVVIDLQPEYAGIDYPWRPLAGVTAFIVHHSETDEPTSDAGARAAIKAIHQFHVVTRGWPGFAYNSAIWRDRFYLVRPADRMGWHSAGTDANQNGIGDWNEKGYAVVLLGNYTSTRPSVQTLRTIVAAKQHIEHATFNDRTLELRGHRDGWPTECPGSWWPAWKAEVTK